MFGLRLDGLSQRGGEDGGGGIGREREVELISLLMPLDNFGAFDGGDLSLRREP